MLHGCYYNALLLSTDDSWILDITCLQWTQLTHFRNNRPRLWHTASVSQDQDVLIYGGCENNILDYEHLSVSVCIYE